MSARERLDAIAARAAAAAAPPWAVWGDECRIEGRDIIIYDEGGHTREDAEFIAHSRTDVDDLVAFARAVLDYPTLTRDMVSRGDVRRWIETQADRHLGGDS